MDLYLFFKHYSQPFPNKEQSMKALRLPFLGLSLFVFFAIPQRSIAEPVVTTSAELDPIFSAHLEYAVEAHPTVIAAKLREQAAGYVADALVYTFDSPEWVAAAGYARGADDVPGISIGRISPADAVTFSGGVEAPVGGGVYAGAGVAQRVLTASDAGSDLRQTAIGVRARVPLLQDFQYGLHRHEVSKSSAEAFVIHMNCVELQHSVGRNALLAWNTYLRSQADLQAVGSAVSRAVKLYEQTFARAELKDVAAYQIFATKYEVALRQEELREVQQNLDSELETLRERLGLHTHASEMHVSDPVVGTNNIFVVGRALAKFEGIVFPISDVLNRHPRCLLKQAEEALAATELSLMVERAKDAVDVTAGMGWRGETDSGFFGDDALETRRNEVLEVGVYWKRPLDKRGVRTDIAVARTRLAAVRADRQAVENEVLAALARAQNVFSSACGRLQLASSAIEEARKALEAEEARFNLGEGTSRNVLDAQKDLTSATRRGISVFSTVISAWVELVHASGRNAAEIFIPVRHGGVALDVTQEGE